MVAVEFSCSHVAKATHVYARINHLVAVEAGPAGLVDPARQHKDEGKRGPLDKDKQARKQQAHKQQATKQNAGT